MTRHDPQPPLRRHFDRVERAIGARLEEAVATRTFTDAMILALRAQVGAFRLLERGSREVLHLWNIPTRSDVMRVSRQLSALEREELLTSDSDPARLADKNRDS